MKPMMRILVLGLAIAAGNLSYAQERPAVDWATTDLAGGAVKVPGGDRPSLLVFVQTDQEKSREALKQIAATLGDAPAQVIVIVSGPGAADRAKTLAGQIPAAWRVVADPDFSGSGKLGAHVWPTTLVIKPDGTQVAHLAGVAAAFPTELQAYLEFANGKLDEPSLAERLSKHAVISDDATQAAARHLQVAQRLIEQGSLDQAQSELAAILSNLPHDPAIQLAVVRVCLSLHHPEQAIEILDKLPPGSVPAWQTQLLRGGAMIVMEKWAEARQILPEALKLNPEPAEAHYLMGLVYQHDGDEKNAAEQFKFAYEKSPAAQKTLRLSK